MRAYDFRFAPESRHYAAHSACPFRGHSRDIAFRAGEVFYKSAFDRVAAVEIMGGPCRKRHRLADQLAFNQRLSVWLFANLYININILDRSTRFNDSRKSIYGNSHGNGLQISRCDVIVVRKAAEEKARPVSFMHWRNSRLPIQDD
jgi:hypothetical protein